MDLEQKINRNKRNKSLFICFVFRVVKQNRPTNSAIPPGNFEMLSRHNNLDLCRLFKLNNSLGQVVIQSKKKSAQVQLI